MKFAALLFACALLVLLPPRAQAAPDARENLAITHLMQYVRESGLQFIRNSKSYSAGDAADHMQKKLDYARDRLTTADEFIDYVASRSSITNLPYYVVTADGKKQELGPWLYAELDKFRAAQTTKPPRAKNAK
ncbi:MAG: DUF5329 family protein [Alphaproteobacteria bacterium]|jgi:hypothetical protein|nr:DUF5329 family protein [Alphaproteobacteria bacterium]